MAINKNHEFDELDGAKCAVVEKNASKDRAAFLKELLEHNGFTVVVVPSPPPKTAPAPKPATTPGTEPAETPVADPQPEAEKTFTIGVTNVSFNPTNAIFGRQLKTKTGKIVTQAYWEGRESESRDDVPYFESE